MDLSDHYVEFLPPSVDLIGWSLLLLFLLIVSAFVSASEAGFFSLGFQDVEKIKQRGDEASRSVIGLLNQQDYLLSTILIVNNLVNIGAVIVANTIIDLLIDFNGVVAMEFLVKTVIVTFLLLLFGEIFPKIVATYNPVRFVLFAAPRLVVLRSLCRPFSRVLVRTGGYFNEVAAKRKDNLSMDELSEAIEITTSQTAEDKKILTGIVRFVNTEVSEIMRNRVEIVAVDLSSSLSELKELFIRSGFSRIPVYEEELDNIRGVVYVKDLIEHIDEENFPWQEVIREAYFVPEHKKINDLLEEFQSKQIHLAIVVDEYGSTQGIVSLEDILEEIVGEISDETDLEERYYTKIDAKTFIFEGKTHIGDFLRIFDLDTGFLDDVRGEAETLAGIMLEVKREFLSVGDQVSVPPFTFIVESVSGMRVDKIRVIRA